MTDKEDKKIKMEGAVGGTVNPGEMKEEKVRVDEIPKEVKEEQVRVNEQIQEIRELVLTQAQTIITLSNQVTKETLVVEQPVRKYPSVMVKPRDVPTLTIVHLEGMEAAGYLKICCDLIKQVTEQDAERVRVAKTRVDTDLTLLIQNHQRKGKCLTWEDMKLFFQTDFVADLSFDRAWLEIEKAKYDWDESPQAFTNHILCKYAVVESKFPSE